MLEDGGLVLLDSTLWDVWEDVLLECDSDDGEDALVESSDEETACADVAWEVEEPPVEVDDVEEDEEEDDEPDVHAAHTQSTARPAERRRSVRAPPQTGLP